MHQLPSDAINDVNKHVNRLSTQIKTREMTACKQYPHLCSLRLQYVASVCVCVSCCFINLLNLPDLISPGQTQPGDISLDKLIALIEQMDP